MRLESGTLHRLKHFFMKQKLRKGLSPFVLIGFLLFNANSAQAQLSGVKTIPADYPSIAAFVADLNAQGVGPGGVTLTVASGYTETAPAGGYQITATGTAANPIIIQSDGFLPLPVITANGSLTAGALNDAIFVLVGADYVTLDGFQLQENAANTTTTPASNNMTEWGVALVYASGTDGAQNNTISDNVISLNKTYANTWGIYSNTRHTLAAPTATADITASSGSNSNNKIYGNAISNVNMGIAFIGSSTAANMDSGNDIGGTSALTGNTLTNWGGASAASSYISNSGTSYCIYSNHQIGENISYNTLTSASVSGTVVTFRGIFKDYTAGQPSGTFSTTISNNTITLSSAFTSGTFECVKSQGLTPVLSTATLNINNNTMLNCVVSGAASSSNMVGFSNSSAFGIISMSNNVTRGNTSTATSGGFTGVLNSGAANTSVTLNNNQIGNGSGNAITFSAATSGTVIGVSSTGGTNTCALSMTGNTFQGFIHSVTGSSSHTYLNSTATTFSQNISNNQFVNLSVNTSGNITFVVNAPTLPASGSMTINNNAIVTAFAKPNTGGSVTFYASNASSPNGTTVSLSNNNLSNISLVGTTGFIGINNTDGASSSSGPTKTINGNTLSSISTTGSGSINLITCNFAGANSSVSNNTISSINWGAAVTGMSLGANNQGTLTANGNTINNVATSTGAVTGLSSAVPAACTISQNTISNLTTSGASTATGITLSSTTPSVFGNKIYAISANNAGGSVNGITVSGGTTVSVYNNLIGGLTAPLASSGTDVIRGINITSSTATSVVRIYYNTVYLNATSSGANFGTSGIFHTASGTATTASLDMRNNIIINESVAGGTGLTVAYRRSGTALNNFSSVSNRNLLFAGIASPTNVLFNDGTSSQVSLANYQAAVTPREFNSITGESFSYSSPGSFFISLTGSSSDYLRPVAGITTLVESAAEPISVPAITTDYAGAIRAGNFGYSGTGTAPDLGAFEFQGSSPAPQVTFNSIVPGTAALCSTTPRVISVNVTTPSGSITGVVINYAFNGSAQTPITMTNTSGTTWEGTIPVATPVNAQVTWSVVATSTLGLTASYSGTAYADEPLFGYTAAASALPASICLGDNSVLSVLLTNPAAAPTYLAPPAVSSPTTDEDLGNITITKGVTTILNNTTARNSLVGTIGTASGTVGSYSNFTAFGPYALNVGDTYNFSISSLQSVSAFNNAMAIYIDYNRNGVFTDAGEQVFTSPTLISGAHTLTGSFVVPAGAAPGLTRMRLISNETTLITSPTQSVSFGEYEEYTINLLPSLTSITWSDGVGTVGTGNALTVTPTATTTYTATLVSAGCTFAPSPTAVVTVNPLPTAPTANNSLQCGTQVPTASVTSTTGATTPTFKWYDAAVAGTLLQSSTSVTYTTSVSATTTFYVSEVDGVTGCESPRTAVTVTVSAADPVAAATSSATICIGSSFDLTASNTNPIPNQNYTYSWSGVSGSGAFTPVAGSPATITPTSAGTFTYTLSAVDGLCIASATVDVTVNPFAATLSPIDATCNGLANGSFSLASSSCGTAPYNYSVNGSPFGPIPTNLAAGIYNVVIEDDNGFQTSPLVVTIAEPSTTISVPVSSDIAICEGDLSGQLSATSFTSVQVPGSLVVSFDVAAQPTETNSAPGNIVASATYTLPAGATVTGGTLNYNNLTATGGSWMSDIRLGFSGAVTNAAAAGTGSADASGNFNYTRAIPAGGITSGGTVNLLYWDFVSDNAGSEATFNTGTGVATLTINYTLPTPAGITWWDAPTGGTQLGTGSPFETVGTSVLPVTVGGTYTFYAEGDGSGCPSPSRTPVDVVVNQPTSSTIVAADCDSYTLNSITYTTTGTYTQVVTGVNGCDSTITLDLTIYGPTTSTTAIGACDAYTWTDGNTYTVSGIYTQTLVNYLGCDSIATLDLTINNNSSTTTITNCGAYVWTDGNTYSTSGTYTQTLTNIFGCDSVATLDLTVVAPTSSSLVATACDSYTLNTQTYTASGTYTQVLTNVAGCDSTITLDLTINLSNSSNMVAFACDAYLWTDGNTYTASGTYTQTLTNMAGCDSIATLVLTITNTPVATATDNGDATITASAGAAYQWIDCATNSAIAGATSQTFNVLVNGDYAVVVSNGSCDDTSACVNINYIGMEENTASQVAVYPNPTRGNVKVTFNSANAYVEVYDAQGKLMTAALLESGDEINLSDFERGVYYLRVKSDAQITTHRIVRN